MSDFKELKCLGVGPSHQLQGYLTMNTKNDDLLKAAVNASNTIVSFYEWIDRINAAGGATSVSGVAECHAFLKSMEKNRARLDKLIMEPLQAQIAARKGGAA